MKFHSRTTIGCLALWLWMTIIPTDSYNLFGIPKRILRNIKSRGNTKPPVIAPKEGNTENPLDVLPNQLWEESQSPKLVTTKNHFPFASPSKSPLSKQKEEIEQFKREFADMKSRRERLKFSKQLDSLKKDDETISLEKQMKEMETDFQEIEDTFSETMKDLEDLLQDLESLESAA